MSKKTTKFVAVPLMVITLFASGFGFQANRAEAALSAVGPVLDLDVNGLATTNGFPAWFADENGLRLQLCLDQNPAGLCLLTPDFDPNDPALPNPATPIGTVLSGAFPDESFYAIASADLSPANVRLPGANQDIKILWFAALEQAFLSGIVPGGQSIFLRSQVDIAGLVPGQTYNFTTPYGPMSVVADGVGGGRTRLEDIVVCNVGFPCNFNVILPGTQTNVGAFLQWDPAVSAPPLGFIGDPNVDHEVIGGQGGVNTLTVNGTSVGGVGVDTANTNLFSVAGQLAPSAVAFTTQPSVAAIATTPLVAQPVVALQGGGVTLPSATGDIALGAFMDSLCTIAAPAGTLTGTTTQASVAGVATFAGIGFNAAGTFFIGASSSGIATTCATAATVVAPAVMTAVADTVSTTVDTALTIPSAQLLANDETGSIPPTTLPIVVASVQNAINGTVVLNVDGTITFTPTPGFTGTASFDYTINDSSAPVLVSVGTVTVDVALPLTPIYRLYNTVTGAHVYTRGETERAFIMNKFPVFEFTDGIPAFNASLTAQAGLTPIYRLFNTQTGVHLYTRGEVDRDFVMNKFPAFEFTDGVPAFYASLDAQAGLTPIYRLFNTQTGVHLYTRGEVDRDFVINKFPAFEFTDGRPAFFAKIN